MSFVLLHLFHVVSKMCTIAATYYTGVYTATLVVFILTLRMKFSQSMGFLSNVSKEIGSCLSSRSDCPRVIHVALILAVPTYYVHIWATLYTSG